MSGSGVGSKPSRRRDHDRLTISPSDRGTVSDVSYSVDIEADNLICRSERAAHEAAAIINGDAWMRRHLRVSVAGPAAFASPEEWRLVIEEFDGCSWNEEASDRVWVAVRGCMADGAAVEFRHEEGPRYRIRWAFGFAVVDQVMTTTWEEVEVLVAPRPE